MLTGLVSWILAGVAATGVARLLPWLRRHWLAELLTGIVAAFAAGLYATGADFGGWRELELRSVLFAFFAAAAFIALLRLVLPRRR